MDLHRNPVIEQSRNSRPSVLCLKVRTLQHLGEATERQLDEFTLNYEKFKQSYCDETGVGLRGEMDGVGGARE